MPFSLSMSFKVYDLLSPPKNLCVSLLIQTVTHKLVCLTVVPAGPLMDHIQQGLPTGFISVSFKHIELEEVDRAVPCCPSDLIPVS